MDGEAGAGHVRPNWLASCCDFVQNAHYTPEAVAESDSLTSVGLPRSPPEQAEPAMPGLSEMTMTLWESRDVSATGMVVLEARERLLTMA